MKQKLLMTVASVLLLAAGLLATSCVKNYVLNDTQINTAVKVAVSDVTASSATVSLTPTQGVAAYIVAGPVLKSSYPTYASDDAIAELNWIKENGQEISTDPEAECIFWTETELLAGTEYLIGCVSVNADGTICSAPWFETFTTGTPVATPIATLESTAGGKYVFSYSLELNEYTSKCKYIVSLVKAVSSYTDAELIAYIAKYGKTTTEDIEETEISSGTAKTDLTVAAIPYDDLDRPGALYKSIASPVTTVKVKVGAKETTLKAQSEDVEYFTGTVDVPATGNFTVDINGVEYGFTAYSGNGGVGTVNNMYAAMPFHNLTSEMTYQFYVEKARGQMSAIALGGQEFWVNLSAASKLNVTVDMTNGDGNYRYYMELVKADDPNLVFYEGFDLSVWGGFYQAPVKGTFVKEGSVDTWDGTEVATKDGASTTGMGVDNFCWPASIPLSGSEVYTSEALMKNWGLQDWTFKKGYLSAGHMRIAASSTKCCSYVFTPKMSKLTAATTVTLTFECWSFAATIEDLHFDVVGAGQFKTAVVTNTAGYNQTFNDINSTQFIPDGQMIVKHANADVNKTITKFVFTVEGATADTQFRFGTDDAELANIKNARICIDYVKVTK